MAKIGTAQNNAQPLRGVRVVAVLPCESADVYCMRVPDTGCFSVEGGIIVSNCYDETRYELMAVRHTFAKSKLQGI